MQNINWKIYLQSIHLKKKKISVASFSLFLDFRDEILFQRKTKVSLYSNVIQFYVLFNLYFAQIWRQLND